MFENLVRFIRWPILESNFGAMRMNEQINCMRLSARSTQPQMKHAIDPRSELYTLHLLSTEDRVTGGISKNGNTKA